MMGHPQHQDGSVDKGDEFIRSGMTLISEYDSEKYLKKAAEQKRRKDAMNDFIERWTD